MIIPFFLSQEGCPHRCIYCDGKKLAGEEEEISPALFRKKVELFLQFNKREKPLFIAFYGGNFTGLKRERQEELLGLALPYIEAGLVEGIRISTRPDYIEEDTLSLLKDCGVRTVEVGVQSMDDNVLSLSQRGYKASNVLNAVKLLKLWGFEVGVHLMVGLPGESALSFSRTVKEIVDLKPHTVRLHPTVVFAGTELAQWYLAGCYQPLTLEQAIYACRYALREFTLAGISVIRLGLQTNEEMRKPGAVIGGPYHPTLGALVEESIFLDMAQYLLAQLGRAINKVSFSFSPRDESFFRGKGNRNLWSLRKKFPFLEISLSPDKEIRRGSLVLNTPMEMRCLTKRDFFQWEKKTFAEKGHETSSIL